MEKKTVYKCAFGQKIAADLEWIVAKKKIEKKDEIVFNEKTKVQKQKEYEIVYDINGRPKKQKCAKVPHFKLDEANPVENAEDAEKYDCVGETILEAEQPNAEESPLQIPGWLSNPFQNNNDDLPEQDNDGADGVVL